MKNFDEFYPTPESVLDLALEGIRWTDVETVLEPSAGKGDIVEYLKSITYTYDRDLGYRKCKEGERSNLNMDVDCIEKEEELRHILTGKKSPRTLLQQNWGKKKETICRSSAKSMV